MAISESKRTEEKNSHLLGDGFAAAKVATQRRYRDCGRNFQKSMAE